jgi:putative transcriptional regulator
MDLEDIPWRTKLPGFKEYDLGEIDGLETSLFWIRPGRAIPAHTHRGVELSLILDGAFTDLRGRFGPGDISVADDSIDHRPVAEKKRPCIGFAVVDQPLKLTGSLTQMLGDIIG